MSTCLAFCAAAAAPAATWALTPLTVGLGLNAAGLVLAAVGTSRARADSREARQRQQTAEDRERTATERALDQSRRQQAATVAAWTVVEPSKDDGALSSWSNCHVRMANRSDLPVTQITVVLGIPRWNRPIFREVLGPGETWDDPVDYLSPEQDGADFPVLSTAFTDAEGQKWARDKTGLHQVDEGDH